MSGDTMLLVRNDDFTGAWLKNSAASFDALLAKMGEALEGEVPRDRNFEVIEVTVTRRASVKRVAETRVTVSVEEAGK